MLERSQIGGPRLGTYLRLLWLSRHDPDLPLFGARYYYLNKYRILVWNSGIHTDSREFPMGSKYVTTLYLGNPQCFWRVNLTRYPPDPCNWNGLGPHSTLHT